MPIARWSQLHAYFECCVGRASCSGRQMRNGFFMLNLIAWVLLIIGAELLA